MIDLSDLAPQNLVRLYDYDLYLLGEMANEMRQKMHQKKVFFNLNRHINPSNICVDVCKFCAFSSHRKNPNPYEMTKDEIVSDAKAAFARGAREFHIVSAHNPNYGYEWYFEIFSALKSALPAAHIKAMTAAEVDFLHRRFGKSYETILRDMRDFGVDSMPGGGAEIFEPEIRKKICAGKVSGEDWLRIHGLWHKMGKKSNATMLFLHIEERIHRISHILEIRKLQDSSLAAGESLGESGANRGESRGAGGGDNGANLGRESVKKNSSESGANLGETGRKSGTAGGESSHESLGESRAKLCESLGVAGEKKCESRGGFGGESSSSGGGFNAFIPLLYQRENNFLTPKAPQSAQEILKTIAISRILLPNVPHIKAYWATLGLNLALVAQEFGADDIDGTIERENIQSAAGAASKRGLGRDELVYKIKDAGFEPVLRDSLYNELERL